MASPEVSIILPTFNRLDVIGRAVASVILQTHADWELIVVDDGSTDGTLERLQGLDPRLRLLRQPNQGVYGARNTGLAAARGRWITFLDSDDAWMPHFLALTTAFLRAHPDRRWVSTEFLEDLGDGSTPLLHDRDGIVQIFCRFARSVGSSSLDLAPGLRDDYLRVYQRKRQVGAWGRDIVEAAGHPRAMVYEGELFPHMRWGYLNWLPASVFTREAIEAVGPFTTHTRSAADYRFLARVAQAFPATMIAVPSAIKHERAQGSRTLAQDHLATGAGAYRFEVNKLGFFDELYGGARSPDPEIRLIRRHHCLEAGHRALALGHRQAAREHLAQAFAWRPGLWRAGAMLALATVVTDDARAASWYRGWLRAHDVLRRLLTGRLRPRVLAGKVLGRLGRFGRGAAARAGEGAAPDTPSVTDSALAALDQPSSGSGRLSRGAAGSSSAA